MTQTACKSLVTFFNKLSQPQRTSLIPDFWVLDQIAASGGKTSKLVQSKWSTKVHKLQQAEGQNALPSFSVLVREVTFHAEWMNIPQISQTAPVSDNRRNVASCPVTPSCRWLQSSKGRDQSLSLAAPTTHTNPDSEESSEGNKPIENFTPAASSQSQITPATPKLAFYPFHRTKSHNLDECQKFRELDFAKRRDFLFRQKLCFNCAKSTENTSRNCSQRLSNCKICANKHFYASPRSIMAKKPRHTHIVGLYSSLRQRSCQFMREDCATKGFWRNDWSSQLHTQLKQLWN